jgi:hypothetical protein
MLVAKSSEQLTVVWLRDVSLQRGALYPTFKGFRVEASDPGRKECDKCANDAAD